jgi:hypothetical protein
MAGAPHSVTDVIPPPPLPALHRLQLMRYTLVKLIMECRNFEDIMTGCYARVLLEMRQNRSGSTAGASGNNYFIVKIKGVHRGPSYSGFSWDGVTTDFHILIEIPSCFRSTNPSNNYVQLNSISNSPFSDAEYDEWVRLHREAQCPFQSVMQLDLRWATLQEHLEQIKLLNARQSRSEHVDPVVAERIRTRARLEVKDEYVCMPQADQLSKLSSDDLYQLQRRCHEMMEQLRQQVYTRTRCQVCNQRTSMLICYPCKHQVLCVECQNTVTHCPVKSCGKAIQNRIKPFTNE